MATYSPSGTPIFCAGSGLAVCHCACLTYESKFLCRNTNSECLGSFDRKHKHQLRNCKYCIMNFNMSEKEKPIGTKLFHTSYILIFCFQVIAPKYSVEKLLDILALQATCLQAR